MTPKNPAKSQSARLRHKAEERVAKRAKFMASNTRSAAKRAIHELEVHQVELEMQNASTQEAIEPRNLEMTNGFENIRIVSMDGSAATHTIPASNFMNIVLTLSSSAPDDWASCFNVRWNSRIYIAKAAAHVCANRLEICCVPEELGIVHLPELKAIIAETNQVYRQFMAEERQCEAGLPANPGPDMKMLEELIKNIEFD